MSSLVLEQMKKEEAQFDMTPMIDCVFLLIVFFMIVSEIRKLDYESLRLPIAQSAAKPDKAKDLLVVNVVTGYNDATQQQESHIVIRGHRYDTEERLKAKMKEIKDEKIAEGKSPDDITVVIRADYRVEYYLVQRVMMASMYAGLANLSFGAAPK